MIKITGIAKTIGAPTDRIGGGSNRESVNESVVNTVVETGHNQLLIGEGGGIIIDNIIFVSLGNLSQAGDLRSTSRIVDTIVFSGGVASVKTPFAPLAVHTNINPDNVGVGVVAIA